MSGRIIAGLSLTLVVVVALVLKATLAKPPVNDRTLLLGLVDHIAAAAEKRQIKEVRRWLSKRYEDGEGRDYATMSRYLALHLLRRSQLSVYVLGKEVGFGADERHASMVVKALFTRAPRVNNVSKIIPESAKAVRIEIQLYKSEPGWRVTSTQWKNLRVGDVLP